MAELTGGAAVVDGLVAHGIRDVFGIPGTHNLEIYRHLAGSGIRHVTPRHEQGGGYAVDGYARLSGRPGVLITTSGPGITNAITALATSYADSVPVLAISPGMPRGTIGRDIGWLHELKDQQAVLDAVCARSIRVESADEIPETIADIFAGFATRRPRPIHLEVPVDVLEGPWRRRPIPVRALPDPVAPAGVTAVVAALAGAERPVLIAGGGARGAGAEIRALADLGLPVMTTVNGKGVLDENHPAALGASIRLAAAHRIVNEADVLLVVGSELGDSDLWGGEVLAGGNGRTVIRVDIDPSQLHKNVPADLAILGDAATVLHAFLSAPTIGGAENGWWTHEAGPRELREALAADAARDAGPWAAMQRSLASALPDNTVVCGDSSQVTYYGTVHHWTFTPANRLLYPTGYATLGYGLPAAIGAKVAEPDRPVIGLFGDGAAMFTIAELVTATELRLGLPVVIVDNGGYAEIRDQMVDRGIEPQGVDLYRPDLPALARAIGGYGVVAETADELGPLAAKALEADRPTVIYHAVDGGR